MGQPKSMDFPHPTKQHLKCDDFTKTSQTHVFALQSIGETHDNI